MGHVYYRKQKRTGWENNLYAVHKEIESVKTYFLTLEYLFFIFKGRSNVLYQAHFSRLRLWDWEVGPSLADQP